MFSGQGVENGLAQELRQIKQKRGDKVDEESNHCIRAGSCHAFVCRIGLCTIF